jgi:hypothetical protein
MAEPTSLDPFSLVRDLVSQLEKGVNEFANPLMKSDGFAQGANKVMSAAMVAKKLAQELTQRYFEALNVPSRSDVIALGDRLQALEDRLINMQSTLDRLAGGTSRPALAAPARTRKPPAPAPAPVVKITAAPARKRTRKAKA